ncbi:MAG: sulfite exporter TauE/SafE family protein [Kiritimatiellales bacterium]|nr:sulfite exporter TauE/SafE family protein [Kiritimatiellales bacterium]
MEFADLDILGILLRLGLGVVIGFSIGLTGVGGGVLGLQAMTLALGMDPIRAVGTTSLYIFLTNISASFHHAKLKNIAWGSVLRLLCGAIPANILIAAWISRQGENDAFKHSLKTFIICIVFFSVGVMVINAIKNLRRKIEDEERSVAAGMRGHGVLRNAFCVLLGAAIGGLIGATSVGGGVLIVPMLIIIFGLSASRTVGSSIFMAMVLTFITALVYGKGGEVDAYSAIVMAVGSLLGVRYGSRLSVKLPDTLLRWIMIGVILTAAIMMVANR